MVEEGYLAAGYEYIVIDDCWLEKDRNASGYLQPDRKRFPYGMQALSKFVSKLHVNYSNLRKVFRVPGITVITRH